MGVKYKIDVLSALKKAGFSTYRLQKDNLLGSSTIQKIKKGEVVAASNLSVICRLLKCQPGDLLEYIEE